MLILVCQHTRNRKDGQKNVLPQSIFKLVLTVVFIGHSHAFFVVYVPLEYIQSIPPHSTYVIVYFVGARKMSILSCHLEHDLVQEVMSSNPAVASKFINLFKYTGHISFINH